MKKHLIFLFLISPHVVFSYYNYQNYAHTWRHNYIYTNHTLMNKNDLDAVRQLILLSRDRAAHTLKVQDYIWRMLNLYWKGWQNFAQLRLNPSKERPHAISSEEQCATIDFWPTLERHEQLCDAYNKHAQAVVYGDALATQRAKDAVAEMRKQARVCMLDALTDVKKQLEALYEIVFKTQEVDLSEALHAALDDLLDDGQIRAFNLSNFLVQYVPNLMVHKFIEADAFYAILSEEGWTILDKIQRIGNQAWFAIETARVAFYQALLDELDAIG